MNLQLLIYAAGFTSLSSLLLGWFLSMDSLVAMAVFLPAGVWVYALRKEWQIGFGLGFSLATVLAALGMWRGMPVWLGLMAVLSAIILWDLTHLQWRTSFAVDETARAWFINRHLFRLAIWLLACLLIGGFALFGKMRFSFNQALILLAVMISGLGFMVFWLRSKGQSS